MAERLVDVEENDERLLHVFPVRIDGDDADDGIFKEKALECAAHAGLTPEAGPGKLRAHMHVSHAGALEPSEDKLGVLAETKEGLEQSVRERAYFLWKEAGEPEGSHNEFWHRAEEQCLRERAYALWEREGRPEGRADKHWFQMRAHHGI